MIVDIFREKYNVQLSIKHPNDIVFNEKKIGGILTQSKVSGNKLKYLVTGIGLNTNQEHFNHEISKNATSIKNEFGIIMDTNEFVSEFCNRYEEKF